MTVEETRLILRFLKACYPAFFAKMSIDQKKETVRIWHAGLSAFPFEDVKSAVENYISNSRKAGYPPQMPDILNDLKSFPSYMLRAEKRKVLPPSGTAGTLGYKQNSRREMLLNIAQFMYSLIFDGDMRATMDWWSDKADSENPLTAGEIEKIKRKEFEND